VSCPFAKPFAKAAKGRCQTFFPENNHLSHPRTNPTTSMQALLLAPNAPLSALTILRPLPPAGLLLPFPRDRRFVPAEQILAMSGERNYTRIYFTNGCKLLYSKTLGYVLGLLPTPAFSRIHRSHAVNRQYIRTIDAFSVELVDGSAWAVSRRKGRVVRKKHKP